MKCLNRNGEGVLDCAKPLQQVVEAPTVGFMHHFALHVVKDRDALSVFEAWAAAYVNMARRATPEQYGPKETHVLLREVLLAGAIIDSGVITTRPN